MQSKVGEGKKENSQCGPQYMPIEKVRFEEGSEKGKVDPWIGSGKEKAGG